MDPIFTRSAPPVGHLAVGNLNGRLTYLQPRADIDGLKEDDTMAKSRSHKTALLTAALVLPVALVGCGGSNDTVTTAKVGRGIYTTASDCAASGKLTYEQCSDLISSAVDKHEADAPTYTELRFCEAKEGDGKCEFTANQKIRPKLMAFLITNSEPPQSSPLYATAGKEPGFRDLRGATYLHTNAELVFSDHAVTIYERNNARKTGRF